MNDIEAEIIEMCHILENKLWMTTIEKPINRLALEDERTAQVTVKLETDETLWIKEVEN